MIHNVVPSSTAVTVPTTCCCFFATKTCLEGLDTLNSSIVCTSSSVSPKVLIKICVRSCLSEVNGTISISTSTLTVFSCAFKVASEKFHSYPSFCKKAAPAGDSLTVRASSLSHPRISKFRCNSWINACPSPCLRKST